jgi:hypothetical protein
MFPQTEYSVPHVIRIVSPLAGTIAYAISPAGAIKLLDIFQLIECHIDF